MKQFALYYIYLPAAFFLFIRLVVALSNVLFRASLPNSKTIVSNYAQLKIDILIPARNEEHNIAKLIESLLKLETQHDINILILDDNSTDATSQIISDYSIQSPKLAGTTGKELPSGWLGKNFACHQLSDQSRPDADILIYLDADIQLHPNSIDLYLDYFRNNKLDFLSIFPDQQMVTLGEKMVVPIMHHILLSLLPLALVKGTKLPSLSAANGQFIAITKAAYQAILPHKQFKNNPVEDIAMARHYKSLGYKCACLLGRDLITCRMYQNFGEGIIGFSKNFRAFFHYSYVWLSLFFLLGTVSLLISTFFVSLPLAVVILFSALLLHILTLNGAGQLTNLNTFLSPIHTLTMILLFVKSVQYRKGKKYIWKNRQLDI